MRATGSATSRLGPGSRRGRGSVGQCPPRRVLPAVTSAATCRAWADRMGPRGRQARTTDRTTLEAFRLSAVSRPDQPLRSYRFERESSSLTLPKAIERGVQFWFHSRRGAGGNGTIRNPASLNRGRAPGAIHVRCSGPPRPPLRGLRRGRLDLLGREEAPVTPPGRARTSSRSRTAGRLPTGGCPCRSAWSSPRATAATRTAPGGASTPTAASSPRRTSPSTCRRAKPRSPCEAVRITSRWRLTWRRSRGKIRIRARLRQWFAPEERGWFGGDNHVHAQHDATAAIRTDLAFTALQARANGLSYITEADSGPSPLGSSG